MAKNKKPAEPTTPASDDDFIRRDGSHVAVGRGVPLADDFVASGESATKGAGESAPKGAASSSVQDAYAPFAQYARDLLTVMMSDEKLSPGVRLDAAEALHEAGALPLGLGLAFAVLQRIADRNVTGALNTEPRERVRAALLMLKLVTVGAK